MCGIAGFTGDAARVPDASTRGRAMLDALAHRGPDGTGTHAEPSSGVWLGHRRLAIIDVTGGKQPLCNEDSTVWVTFNGCIYNYQELRQELVACGHRFRTNCDTEVIVHAYEEWDEACVTRFNGMWAFALWDGRRKQLFCSRDRIGVKPFYWHFDGESLSFASEPKALFAAGLLRPEPDLDGIRQYLTFQLCLGDRTMFRGLRRLPPGHNLRWSEAKGPEVSRFWDLDFVIDETMDEARAVARLRGILADAVRLRLRSDVPLGAHLSGGLDSSVVLGLAREALPQAHLKAFTGAFEDGPAFDERRWARAMTEHAAADGLEIVFGSRDFRDTIEKIIWHMDEPAAGPGVFPQYGVSRLASQHVKVVLGGQGGDEIFIGYARYLVAYLEECLKGAIEDTASRGHYVATLGTIVPSLPTLQNYLPMLRSFFSHGLFEAPALRYFRLMDRFADVERLVSTDFPAQREKTLGEFRAIFEAPHAASMINRILYFDVKAHLQALLHVEDRTSMAWGLESRVPLLDYRLVELMASVKPTVKFRDGKLKHLFLRAIGDLVPEVIRSRKDKMGFPVPLSEWMRGPLREFVGDILGSARARERGLWNGAALLRTIDGEASFGRATWGALCLEIWYRQFIDGGGTQGGSR
jgi:asparagine synthase (glutamine-hydrolysing)